MALSPRTGPRYKAEEWHELKGATVEIWLDGQFYREGYVEEAMPNGSALWLSADWLDRRELLDKSSGFQAWTSFLPRKSESQ